MGQVISTVPSEGVEATEARFYLSSMPPEAKCLAAAVRGHWGIEQSLHWALDVSFNEDRSRSRKGHGPVNFAPLRRMAGKLAQMAMCKSGDKPEPVLATLQMSRESRRSLRPPSWACFEANAFNSFAASLALRLLVGHFVLILRPYLP